MSDLAQLYHRSEYGKRYSLEALFEAAEAERSRMTEQRRAEIAREVEALLEQLGFSVASPPDIDPLGR